MDRVIPPMPPWVEVMRGVVAVVETDTVTLRNSQRAPLDGSTQGLYFTYHHIYHRDACPEIGIRVDFINKRVLAPVSHHECEAQ